MDAWDETWDFVIVGSGAASIVASLVMQKAGKRPLVLEKTEQVGGSTALSGGVLWVPNNVYELQAGVPDTPEKAAAYLDACAGDVGPASSPARRSAFLETAPRVVDFLSAHGMAFVHAEGYSDYHEGQLPGGMGRSRSLVAPPYDMRRLGAWRDKLRRGAPVPIMMHEAGPLGAEGRTFASLATMMRVGWRILRNKLGSDIVGMGTAVQGRLLEIALREKVDIRLSAPVARLITEGERVAGVEILHEGRRKTIRALNGVLINAGGFSHNREMRAKYGLQPASTDWTNSNPGDTGEVQEMVLALGADSALMEQSWWVTISLPPDGTRPMHPLDMSKPFSIVVDGNGDRYVNESTSYMAVGIAMYERHKSVTAVPSWIICDSRNRKRYRWAGAPAGEPPAEWLESGYMLRAETLDELARKCAIDPARLTATVDRFNRFALAGRDDDFHRGESAYDRFSGDPLIKPNPNLGPIEKPPFYAVRLYPGDVGTCGGIMTDDVGRVLRPDGSSIAGLYATGNSTASVMGRFYPGAGASISASMVFGYRAAGHAARLNSGRGAPAPVSADHEVRHADRRAMASDQK